MNKLNLSEIHHMLKIPLGKKIDQHNIERWAVSFWDASKVEKFQNSGSFVMMLPPPNITGNLHLGHAVTVVLQDALIRHRQMQGSRVIWIPGFDHAGLGTQSIVERLLWHQKKMTRQEFGRDNFIRLANEWKDTKRKEMKDQLNRLCLSLDYSREYFTMDLKSSLAVKTAFKRLFRSGLIYRDVRPVFWSNELKTTLSDIEVENVDGVDRYVRTGEIVSKQSTPQWFVKIKEMTQKSVEVIENSSIDVIPQNYKSTWSSRLLDENINQDWCISRQSWWGHRIPAFKLKSTDDIQENWITADNLEEATREFDSKDVVQDPDVLDTWFSSSLLPLTISGWPNPDEFSKNLKQGAFPLDVMETGFDILTFWVSKMVMMSLTLENLIPFKLILLHGMICDSKGKKMSKSKGNVIDPLDVIDGASLNELHQRAKQLHDQGVVDGSQLEFMLENQKKLFPDGVPSIGADGLRAYLLSHDIQKEIIRIQIMQISKIRLLSNKIWNILRFTLNLIDLQENQQDLNLELNVKDLNNKNLSDSDRQVLQMLSRCVHTARVSFEETYQLHRCFIDLEQFWLVHMSANYLKSVKKSLSDTSNSIEARNQKLQILITCLITSTKLMYPFMPHLAEFVFQRLKVQLKQGDDSFLSVGLESYPNVNEWEVFLSKSLNKSGSGQ